MRNFIREEFANISQRSINAAIDQFLHWVQAVVENEGGHIEQVHFWLILYVVLLVGKVFVLCGRCSAREHTIFV